MFLKTLNENFATGPQQAYISWLKAKAFRNGFRKITFIGRVLGVIHFGSFESDEDRELKQKR